MTAADLWEFFKDQLLGTAERPLSIQWPAHLQAQFGPVLLVQRALVEEGVDEGLKAFVACFTTAPALPVEQFIGLRFALAMDLGDGLKRLLPMIVTQATPTTSATPGLSVVNLVGRDPLYIIDQRKRLKTFKNSTVEDVIREVLDEWLMGRFLAGAFTYRILLSDASRYPRRACFVQHPDQSDAQFLFRLMRSNGWSWYWNIQTVAARDAKGVPVPDLVIVDHPRLPSANPTSSMPFLRRDGVQRERGIELLAAMHQLVPEGVDVKSFDHETGALMSSAADTGIDQSEPAGKLARGMRSTRLSLDHLGNDARDLDRMTQVHADHQAFRSHRLRGRGDVRTMAPGTYQVIEDYPLFAGRPVEERTYTTVSVTHVAENNLPAQLHEAAQALAGDPGVPEWAKAEPQPDSPAGTAIREKVRHRYTNQFECVPRDAPLLPFYVEERDEPRQRRLVGIVIARPGTEVTCDEFGRALVRLLGGEDGADTTAWVRLMVQWGGKNHGYYGALRAGTEVYVEVLGPDRLVIVGVLYNGQTPPPQFDHLGGLPDNIELSGIVSRELNNTRQQQLRFNDTPRDISVQLGTDHGATQLNIGALTTPMNRGKNKPRGEGFEVRTDESGAIRAAKSLLLSTWQRLEASDNQLDAQEHQDLMQDFLNLFKTLGQYAVQHQGLPVNTSASATLVADIVAAPAGSNIDPEGKGGEPTISITAPAGVSTTTPKTILSYAGVNIDQVAQQHWQATAGQHYNVNAGQGIGLFAHYGGLAAIAHHGLLRLQSQHGDTVIESSKDIVIAAQETVKVMAKNILLISDGATINLADMLTLMSKGVVACKGTAFLHSGPDSMALELPKFSDAPTDQKFVLRSGPGDDAPLLANHHYKATLSDGSLEEGVTDEQGRTKLFKRDAMHIANIDIIKKPKV